MLGKRRGGVRAVRVSRLMPMARRIRNGQRMDARGTGGRTLRIADREGDHRQDDDFDNEFRHAIREVSIVTPVRRPWARARVRDIKVDAGSIHLEMAVA